MMGAARGDAEYKGSTLEVFTRLANKAGYQVIVPQVRTVAASHTSLQQQLLLQMLNQQAYVQGTSASFVDGFSACQLQQLQADRRADLSWHVPLCCAEH
jgi:hypothetical protein